MNYNCCKTKKAKESLTKITEFLKTIAEPNRLKILCLLQKQDMCVCDIWKYLNLPQNLASHHLKVLKDIGLVSSKKNATKVLYSINPETLEAYHTSLSHYIFKNN